MEKNNKNSLEAGLLSDIGDLAKNNSDNSHDFLQHMFDLIDSDEYNNVSEEIAFSDDDYKEKLIEDYMENIEDYEVVMPVAKAPAPASKPSPATPPKEAPSIPPIALIKPDSQPVSPSPSPSKSHVTLSAEEKAKILADLKAKDLASASKAAPNQAVAGKPVSKPSFADVEVSQAEVKSAPGEAASVKETPSEAIELPVEPAKEELLKKKKRNLVYDLITVACLIVFITCVYKLGDYYYKHFQYKKGMNKLQNMVGDIIPDDDNEEEVDKYVAADISFPDEVVYYKEQTHVFNNTISDKWRQKYASLVELNPDCIGWVKIPDTNIDYPVMFTPDNIEKYLYMDFEGKYLFRGLPFMGEGTELNRSQNYIIYGHRMADHTAFHNIVYYFRQTFADEHPYCYFNTPYGEGKYQVMASIESKKFAKGEEGFRWYNYGSHLSEAQFNYYVENCKALSRIQTDVTAEYGDELLTLATCFRNNDDDGRMIVVFKRIK